jgi:ppGpp synthetase/RelA/SpoT-type nucleotidyltranferase
MKELIDKKIFFEKYNIKNKDFKTTGLEWRVLQKIYSDYLQEIPKLEASAIYIFNRLMKTPHVHSVRYRVKDAEHVIEKIIRKKIKDPGQVITIDNFKSELKDLIGLRALHLFKEEWLSIHELITTTWDLNEVPTVYYRGGDSDEYIKLFNEFGCETKEHPYGYRSVHYIVETKPAKMKYFAEIQVRTIFEEAWSEIDHKIRYPYDQENTLFGQFSLILNRLAGSADEMGTFIQFLKKEIQNKEESIQEKDELIERLEQKVLDLNLKKTDLKFLTDGLAQLKISNPNLDIYKLPHLSITDRIRAIGTSQSSYVNKIGSIGFSESTPLGIINKDKLGKIKLSSKQNEED